MEPRAPRRLRWKATDDALVVHASWQPVLCFAFGALWNAAFLLFSSRGLDVVAGAAAFVFALLAVRAATNRTTFSFESGTFFARRRAFPFRKEVRCLVADIDGFTVVPKPDPVEGHDVKLVTRSGAIVDLPLELNGIMLQSGGRKVSSFGVAPVEQHRFLVDRLGDRLDDARHATLGYRVGTVAPIPASATAATTVEEPFSRDAAADPERRRT